MVLDPQARELLERMAEAGAPSLETLSPVQARQTFQEMGQKVGHPLVAEVINRTIPGPNGDIPIRIYRPKGEGRLPALVYYHGGGWVVGNLETHDGICRTLTNLSSCIVISVDYRLAPEHKFPSAVEDAYAAAKWVYEHGEQLNIDTTKISVGGDSAGGNLATVTSYLAKEHGTPKLASQLLIYPSVNFTAETASMRENAEGYFLTKGVMSYFRNHYLNGSDDATNLLASPYLISDLSDFPPAMVITAEYDPLRDEGEAYAQRLKEAGVRVNLQRYDGMIHGFVSMANELDQGKEALQQIAAFLRMVSND